MKIAVAGTGYVGLSNSILLAQNNEVWAVDIVEEKVDLINHKKSPIVDKEIEEYLAEKPLNLRATTDAKAAYEGADFIIISTPTNYDEKKNYFDTSSVEAVIYSSGWLYRKSKSAVWQQKYHLLSRILKRRKSII